jgi:preprotein translocase subunit SecD
MLTAILGTHGIYEAFMPKISKDKNLKKWFGIS